MKRPGLRGGVVVLALAGLALGSPGASAQSAADFADWTSLTSSTASGTLHGVAISLQGNVQGGDTSGGFTGFNDSAFTPPLTTSDVVELGTDITPFTLQFGSAVANPVFHVDELLGTLRFPSGTQVTKLSGDITVSGRDVVGDDSPEADGTFRLVGTFSSTSFETLCPACGEVFNIHVGAPPPTPPGGPPPAGPPKASCPGGTSPGVACQTSGGVTTITGTGADDTIVGTTGPEVIRGGGGDDRLNCHNGDRCSGGAGKDRIICRDGRTYCTGDSGNDELKCSHGIERCSGGKGKDEISCRDGKSHCTGDSGNDKLKCSHGIVRCTGGKGDDRVDGRRE